MDAILTGTVKPPASRLRQGARRPNIDTQSLPLKDFNTTVSHGSYLQARCSASPLHIQAVFTYYGNGQSPDTANASQPCSD